MNHIKRIAIIGATGRLGKPVAEELAKTFKVRAVVRSVEKAQKVLPSNFELVQGDLRNVSQLREALAGSDAVYLNLSTETTDMNLPFYEEREGVKNLLKAVETLDIKYIAKIGAMGAYPAVAENLDDNIVPNIIRMQGHQMIAESGIPHTFFAPTHFMELLPFMIDGQNLQWVGNTNIKIYWISASDYAKQVVKAFQNPEAAAEHYAVQGPDAISVKDALETFKENYDPTLNIRVAPVWLMRAIGLFNPKMKFVSHLFAYFGSHEDPFYAKQTWSDLGHPTTTLVEFSQNLRADQPH